MFQEALKPAFCTLFISRQNGAPCRKNSGVGGPQDWFVSRLQGNKPGIGLVRSLLIERL